MDLLAPPYMLIATPILRETPFFETVILMAHHDADGALGWVMNRVHEQKASEVLDAEYRGQIAASTPLHVGGPVPGEALLAVFHEPRGDVEARQLAPSLYVSSSPRALPAVFSQAASSSDLVAGRLIHGYSGWSAQQLESEMEAGAWLVLPYARELAFAADIEGLWRRCFDQLGLNPATLTVPLGSRN